MTGIGGWCKMEEGMRMNNISKKSLISDEVEGDHRSHNSIESLLPSLAVLDTKKIITDVRGRSEYLLEKTACMWY
jgi:hypothetical protein